ncbi:oxygenase MpaB family protein [Mycobacterium sp.]|uniref:oxygenase MpaB family protein n=1 Tax=Mycobacterium sp. TaxID=1785 RepID=UPI002D3F9B15|nr:oxygenase MpaB family protein [Mycobacterium sp.]HZA09260.1 oxygenase MpaB family protein [Mycobacterium sp.]
MGAHTRPPAGPRLDLGPQSLLWRWAGDMRIAFEGGTAGLLQTMHPAIGQGLIDHSNFFDDPVDRVFRSLPGILGTIYDGPHANTTGARVRDFHRDIKGTLPSGVRYHALDPHVYWWAHATFQRMVHRVAEYWDRHRLTDRERGQLYIEGCEWYRRYGVTDSVLPADRAAFNREFDRYCREVLQPNPAADYLIEFIGRRAIPDMSASPHYPTHPKLRPLANALLPTLPIRAALAPPMRLVIFGGLPPIVRERFNIAWTAADERRYRLIRATIRATWRYVPESLKWHPAARKGWLREKDRRAQAFESGR